MNHRSRTARVLPIEQPSAFYYRRAQRKLGQFDYPRAVALLREAVKREPENQQYRMDMAEMLTDMSCFAASNEVLFQMLHDSQPNPDCYFGMGCNFIGLQEYDKARESFYLYLRDDPGGEYSEDIDELIEWMGHMFGDGEDLPPRARAAAKHGLRSLDEGAYDKAIRQLTRVLDHAPEALSARNSLAVALHCAGRTPEAISKAEAVLSRDPSNAQALCNLALFQYALGRADEALACLERCEKGTLDRPDDLYKLCATYMELALDERALGHARALCSVAPYDKRALHQRAAICANIGRYREAESCWQRILTVDPSDTVAAWYARSVRSHPQEMPRVTGAYHVPSDEVFARIRRINEYAAEGLSSMSARWRDDPAFASLILWGVYLADKEVKKSLLNLISLFSDAAAETALRAYLTRDGEPDDIKREVMGMLKQMRAKEPYIAIIDDALVEARVSVVSLTAPLPPGYDRVLRDAIASMSPRYPDEDLTRELVSIWSGYVAALGDRPPRITRTAMWAAALECAFRKLKMKKTSAAEVARLWDVSPNSVRANSGDIVRLAAENGFLQEGNNA